MAWGLSGSHSGYEGTGEKMDLNTETWQQIFGKNAVEQSESISIIIEVILNQWGINQYINLALCILFIK